MSHPGARGSDVVLASCASALHFGSVTGQLSIAVVGAWHSRKTRRFQNHSASSTFHPVGRGRPQIEWKSADVARSCKTEPLPIQHSQLSSTFKPFRKLLPIDLPSKPYRQAKMRSTTIDYMHNAYSSLLKWSGLNPRKRKLAMHLLISVHSRSGFLPWEILFNFLPLCLYKYTYIKELALLKLVTKLKAFKRNGLLGFHMPIRTQNFRRP